MPDLLAWPTQQDSMGTSQRTSSRTMEGQWELKLIAEPRSIEHVRRIFRAHLNYWGRADVEFVVLLGLTELLTNVLKHTEDKRAVVLVQAMGDAVIVTVRDFDARLPKTKPANVLAEDGRGLPLLRGLSDAMGIAPTPTGKDVWFRLDCTEATQSGEVSSVVG